MNKLGEKKWKALDNCYYDKHNDATVDQDADQINTVEQKSFEWIIVRDSEGVDIVTTDTQLAISLQAAIQAAIAIVISITVADSDRSRAVVNDLKQFVRTKQRNNQKTIVQGSKGITVTTTDTQVAVNINALLQVLAAIVARLDVA